MSDVGQRERPVQDRVVLLFADRLEYRYLGNRQYRPGNSNIEQEDLRAWLLKQGTSETLITRPAQAQGGRSCRRGQDPLRGEPRGLPAPPLRHDFAVAEEVTVFGNLTKRPDVVLYVNGIALGVLELKRSTVSVGEGIRKRALYDNLDGDENVAVRIDTAVRQTRKDDWRGNRFKEREVFRAVHEELGKYETRAEEIFEIVKSQREY